jgi:RNA polymerase sigma-70 factor (ECF subfamily)
MNHPDPDTDELITQARGGEPGAVNALLDRHRQRLARMIQMRIDPRLRARVDPSDVLQETMAAASQKLPQYLTSQPIPFYPWLRQIAWEQLIHLHDRHLRAGRRSVTREDRAGWHLSDRSSMALADVFICDATSASGAAVRRELIQRVRSALVQLSYNDREVLIQRFMEQLSSKEIAAGLGISENAVNLRHMRALERIRKLLTSAPEED